MSSLLKKALEYNAVDGFGEAATTCLGSYPVCG
jgi:hypothetical protein